MSGDATARTHRWLRNNLLPVLLLAGIQTQQQQIDRQQAQIDRLIRELP